MHVLRRGGETRRTLPSRKTQRQTEEVVHAGRLVVFLVGAFANFGAKPRGHRLLTWLQHDWQLRHLAAASVRPTQQTGAAARFACPWVTSYFSLAAG